LLRSLRRRFAENDMHVYEVRPRKDHRGVDLISDALPFGRLWYSEANAISNAIGFSQFCARSHGAVIRVCDSAGDVIETRSTRAIRDRVATGKLVALCPRVISQPGAFATHTPIYCSSC